MDLWIGPAIVAALVSGVISAVGWFVNSWQTRQLEQARRDEKVHDFQVALLAEISSDVLTMAVFDRDQLLAEVVERYRSETGYSVLVPHLARNVVFDAIVEDIYVLPGDIIGAVVDYERLRQTLEKFADDLRAPSFAQLDAERQLAMYRDYLDTSARLEALARRAVTALRLSLGLNIQDVDLSSRPLAAAQAGSAGAAVQGQGVP
jgi:hypothetical protein